MDALLQFDNTHGDKLRPGTILGLNLGRLKPLEILAHA